MRKHASAPMESTSRHLLWSLSRVMERTELPPAPNGSSSFVFASFDIPIFSIKSTHELVHQNPNDWKTDVNRQRQIIFYPPYLFFFASKKQKFEQIFVRASSVCQFPVTDFAIYFTLKSTDLLGILNGVQYLLIDKTKFHELDNRLFPCDFITYSRQISLQRELICQVQKRFIKEVFFPLLYSCR